MRAMRTMRTSVIPGIIIGLLVVAVLMGCSGRDDETDAGFLTETETEADSETYTESEAFAVASASEAFQILNRIEDAAEFDAEYEKVQSALKDAGYEEAWNTLIQDLSAYYDYLQNETLTRVMTAYPLTETSGKRYLDLSAMAELVGDGFGKNFVDKLYVEGCALKLPPAMWRQEDLYAYCGYGNALDMLMISAEELVVPDAKPKKLTALLVDASEAIYVEGKGLLPMREVDSGLIAERAQKVYRAVRKLSENKITFTGNPALADLIVTVKVTYPSCGMRWTGNRNVLVFGCRANVDIRRVSDGKKASFRAISEPQGRVTAEEGVDTVWMDFPAIVDEDSPQNGIKTVLTWYGIITESDEQPEESETVEESEATESTEQSEDIEQGEESEEEEEPEEEEESQETEGTEGTEEESQKPEGTEGTEEETEEAEESQEAEESEEVSQKSEEPVEKEETGEN